MALGHYMREIGQVQGYFTGGKHPMTTGSKMTRRSNAKRKCLRTKVETDNASIKNDEGRASLVKSVKRCFNLALDTP